MLQPEVHILAKVDWQFFCTFTFQNDKLPDAVRIKMFFALAREVSKDFGLHFHRLLWALRGEEGEATGRFHFHALIAGLPRHAVKPASCFSIKNRWEELGGGIARVYIYDSTLDGVSYVMKGVPESVAFQQGAGNQRSVRDVAARAYELAKFGGRCEVMLSNSLLRHLENRQRAGARANETRGRETASSKDNNLAPLGGHHAQAE